MRYKLDTQTSIASFASMPCVLRILHNIGPNKKSHSDYGGFYVIHSYSGFQTKSIIVVLTDSHRRLQRRTVRQSYTGAVRQQWFSVYQFTRTGNYDLLGRRSSAKLVTQIRCCESIWTEPCALS